MKTVHILAALFLPIAPLLAQDAASMPNRCAANPGLGDITAKPSWNGWGAGISNTRMQSSSAAQLTEPQLTRISHTTH
jgi:hypothetical protein